MSRFAFAAAPSLDVVFFADASAASLSDDSDLACAEADLVVALGNVDLHALAERLPAGKPALCVLGSRDPERRPPEPFRVLHGNGVTFKDWRVAGLCGGLRHGAGGGFALSDEEAAALLSEMPSCDLLITHAPPAGLAGMGAERGFSALTEYVLAKEPIFHFHAGAGPDISENVLGATYVVGVGGMLYPEPLQFA